MCLTGKGFKWSIALRKQGGGGAHVRNQSNYCPSGRRRQTQVQGTYSTAPPRMHVSHRSNYLLLPTCAWRNGRSWLGRCAQIGYAAAKRRRSLREKGTLHSRDSVQWQYIITCVSSCSCTYTGTCILCKMTQILCWGKERVAIKHYQNQYCLLTNMIVISWFLLYSFCLIKVSVLLKFLSY